MRQTVLLGLLAIAGCAGASGDPPRTAPERGVPSNSTAALQEPGALVPPGLGTLRQEEVTVSLRDGALLVKVTPLAEEVIRLLAPDTYERLRSLAHSRRPARDTSSALFLVSFFSYEPDTPFTPEDLQLIHRGQVLRSAAIQPLSSGFDRQRLAQQETQSAVYSFTESLNYDLPILVRYGLVEVNEWLAIQQRLERERSRVQARRRTADSRPAPEPLPGGA
jgi:hypothetical protein